MTDLTRRMMLAGLGCSLAASPLMTPVSFAQAPGDNRLIVIILRGAMDGLDAVQPAGDPAYAALRPTLAGTGAALDGYWALHPALEPLRPLWATGDFGAAHAVSTPYRDRRSHFDGQDILENGTPSVAVGASADQSGWLNRLVTTFGGTSPEVAYAVGREQMLILQGAARTASWAPEADLTLSPQAELLLGLVNQHDPLFAQATTDAIRIAAETAGIGTEREANHLRLARFVTDRLRGETRIATFSLSGWDTHGDQRRILGRALGALSETVLALRDGLGPLWGQTAVLMMTEFGRTARENGSRGTDHGTGGAMLYAGGALRGGQVVTDWPGLTDLYADRDLMPTRDVRAHAGWVLSALFGVSASQVAGTVFPGLDMGPQSALL